MPDPVPATHLACNTHLKSLCVQMTLRGVMSLGQGWSLGDSLVQETRRDSFPTCCGSLCLVAPTSSANPGHSQGHTDLQLPANSGFGGFEAKTQVPDSLPLCRAGVLLTSVLLPLATTRLQGWWGEPRTIETGGPSSSPGRSEGTGKTVVSRRGSTREWGRFRARGTQGHPKNPQKLFSVLPPAQLQPQNGFKVPKSCPQVGAGGGTSEHT